MKLKYETPKMETKEYAQFENVFTYCGWADESNGCSVETGPRLEWYTNFGSSGGGGGTSTGSGV